MDLNFDLDEPFSWLFCGCVEVSGTCQAVAVPLRTLAPPLRLYFRVVHLALSRFFNSGLLSLFSFGRGSDTPLPPFESVKFG